jgi:hypothetical protein
VPLHVDGAGGSVVYVLTSQRTAVELMNAQFHVTLLGEPDCPLRTESKSGIANTVRRQKG